MSNTNNRYIHPDFRVSAARFEALTVSAGIQGSGAPVAQQPAEPALDYQDVLESLAEDAPAFARDMRPLTLRELGAVLGSLDEQAFFDALADSDGLPRQVALALAKAHQSDTERYTAAGIAVVAALRTYLHGVVHKRVTEDWRAGEADRVTGVLEIA